ncbi:DNA modification methylase [Microbacterium sp. G2-8]|uniref:DNA modification methylase n=1 Tax=Microbacterium sp. G2-8 TaxID=2842454 RepID=UPI001C8ADEAA|nr:DNA modification methylase [Microbacterium sp. G2-8]
MTSRTIASLALGGIVLLTATGCAGITPQATTFEYTPSDGVNVPDAEGSDLAVRNAFIVADSDGADGNFIAALVNDGDQPTRLSLDWESGNATVTVAPGETMSLGGEADPILISGLDTMPGETLSMYLQSGDGEGTEIEIPVLNNCLTEYATLAPNETAADTRESCEPHSEVEAH